MTHYNSQSDIVDFRDGNILCPHLYKVAKISSLNEQIWMTYKICCEILVRLGPTVLLVSLNIAIIWNFNLSVHRRKKLRATKFVERSSSQLFPKRSSSLFEAPIKKISDKNLE